MKNLAEACYHNEKLSRNEELLYLLEEKTPDSSVYNMIGNTARLKGEFARAEAAYQRSLEIEFNPVVALNYIEGICEKQDYTEAWKMINKYFSGNELPEHLSERYSRLYGRIKKEAEITLSCASCSREWKVLKKHSNEQASLRLSGNRLMNLQPEDVLSAAGFTVLDVLSSG